MRLDRFVIDFLLEGKERERENERARALNAAVSLGWQKNRTRFHFALLERERERERKVSLSPLLFGVVKRVIERENIFFDFSACVCECRRPASSETQVLFLSLSLS